MKSYTAHQVKQAKYIKDKFGGWPIEFGIKLRNEDAVGGVVCDIAGQERSDLFMMKSTYESIMKGLHPNKCVLAGDIIEHPDGYKVKIVGGATFRNGRGSNFWRWKRLDEEGRIKPKVYSGYGWW